MTQAKLILETVCRELSIRESQLLSPSRLLHLVKARMLAILLLERAGFTDERIGWVLNRTRVTITVMRNKANDELRIYQPFRAKYEQLKTIIDNGTNV